MMLGHSRQILSTVISNAKLKYPILDHTFAVLDLLEGLGV